MPIIRARKNSRLFHACSICKREAASAANASKSWHWCIEQNWFMDPEEQVFCGECRSRRLLLTFEPRKFIVNRAAIERAYRK